MDLDPDDVVLDERLYDASVGTLLDVIGEHGAKAKRMMVVGHNPTWDQAVSWLAETPPRLTDSGKLMTTCAVAHLTITDGWEHLSRGCAKLEGVHRPKEVLG